MLKSIFKFMVASSLIVGGIVVAGTIFTAKSIDKAGDKLEGQIHG